MAGLMFLVGIIVLAIIMRVSIRRFERRRRAEGAWDENGPINPTSALPLGATAYEILDGGLRHAFEQEHGTEFRVRHAPRTPAPIIEVAPSPPAARESRESPESPPSPD